MSIVELIEKSAEKNALRTALVEDATSREFTYQQLLNLSKKLSNVLKTFFVAGASLDNEERTPLVGILTNRGAVSIVSILATLLAGAAYVPIDPSFPDDRQLYMLQHSKCQVVIVEDVYMDRLQNMFAQSEAGEHLPEVVVVNNETLGLVASTPQQSSKQLAGVNKNVVYDPEGLCYVLYTSGSTGKPKGVMVKNKGVMNIIQYFAHELNVTPEDKMLGLTTFCFDISVLENFVPLISGATLVLSSIATQKNPVKIIEALKKYNISIMQATPTTYEMMIGCGWNGDINIRFLVGGEACRPKVAALAPRVKALYNVYGPTETTIWSSCFLIPHNADYGSGGVPVGGPIWKTTFHLVLENGQENKDPCGEGELFIGGEGVAKGYLHAPDLTAKRFLPNPFGVPGEVYRTGDLFRRTQDGNYIFVRRLDDQVKVNGFRIELGEVEAGIAKHPEVEQPVVIVFEDRLVAFVKLVPNHDPRFDSDNHHLYKSITEIAKKTLTHYMIPHYVYKIDDFPKTANGKLDKLTLAQLAKEYRDTAPNSPEIIENKTAEGDTCAVQGGTGNGELTMVDFILNNVKQATGVKPKPSASFAAVGIDSLGAMLFRNLLSQSLGGVIIDADKLYDPDMTIQIFAKQLFEQVKKEQPKVLEDLHVTKADNDNDIETGKAKYLEDKENEDLSISKQILRFRDFIEGFRGFAILMVTIEHFCMTGNTYFETHGHRIRADTSFFIVLTGFTTALQELTQYETNKTLEHDQDANETKRKSDWNLLTYLHGKFVGLFPIYWLVLIFEIPYFLTTYANSSNTHIARVMTLYVLGLSQWCPCEIPPNLYYVSLIWGIFLIYATLRTIHALNIHIALRMVGFSCILAFLIVMFYYEPSDGYLHPPLGFLYFTFAWLAGYGYYYALPYYAKLLQSYQEHQDASMKTMEMSIITPQNKKRANNSNSKSSTVIPTNDVENHYEIEKNTSAHTPHNEVNDNTTASKFSNMWLQSREKLPFFAPALVTDALAFLLLFFTYYDNFVARDDYSKHRLVMQNDHYRFFDFFMLTFGLPILCVLVVFVAFFQTPKYRWSIFDMILTKTKVLVIGGQCSLPIYIMQKLYIDYYFKLGVAGIAAGKYPYTSTFHTTSRLYKFAPYYIIGWISFFAIVWFVQKVYQDRFIANLHLKFLIFCKNLATKWNNTEKVENENETQNHRKENIHRIEAQRN